MEDYRFIADLIIMSDKEGEMVSSKIMKALNCRDISFEEDDNLTRTWECFHLGFRIAVVHYNHPDRQNLYFFKISASKKSTAASDAVQVDMSNHFYRILSTLEFEQIMNIEQFRSYILNKGRG